MLFCLFKIEIIVIVLICPLVCIIRAFRSGHIVCHDSIAVINALQNHVCINCVINCLSQIYIAGKLVLTAVAEDLAYQIVRHLVYPEITGFRSAFLEGWQIIGSDRPAHIDRSVFQRCRHLRRFGDNVIIDLIHICTVTRID